MNLEEFSTVFRCYMPSHLVFVGLGNEYRNDDIAGLLFLRELSAVNRFKDSYYIRAERNPENFLEIILKYDPKALVFIDAADWGGIPGEIRWLGQDELSGTKFSTHTFSIKLIEQYLSAFKEFDFFYLGIQIADQQSGMKVSPAVREAIKNFFKGVEV